MPPRQLPSGVDGPDDLLTVRVEPADDAVVVTVRGEVDLHTVPMLAAALAEAECAPVPLVVVDLSDAVYIGGRGVGTLLAAHQRARASGWELRLAGGGRLLRRLLTVTGTGAVMEHYPDRAAALNQPLVRAALRAP